MQIDKSKPVMITGATGYVASWLVKLCLEKGLTVHAAVRQPDNEKKVGHLKAIAESSPGTIKFFKTDLLDLGSYFAAMQNCELVFHTASPFTSKIKNPQTDLVDPALNGTANVLESVNQTLSVKRVVLTSSCAAIYCDANECEELPSGMFTEDVWNTKSSLKYVPYSYSKTVAERKAWEIFEAQERWDLVTINPSLVLGPPLNPTATTSESFTIMKQMGDGTMKMGAPKMGIGLVDVRDVAEAHLRAGLTPTAKGRYITSAHNSNFVEMAATLLAEYGNDYRLPKKALPKWFVRIIGPMTSKFFTQRYITNNVNVEWRADNSKIQNELGMEFRPMQETMKDSFQALIDAGTFSKKK